MKSSPLISIVTPSFNQGSFIGEALTSVQLQNYANCEHLIIDGMSTDNTVNLLSSAAANHNKAKIAWRSEHDTGQSEALNKGFRLAQGEIIGWLNSDDRYRAGCFDTVVKTFKDNPEIDIVYGDYLVIGELGEPLKICREIEFDPFILLYHRVLYIPTTATFFRRRIFEEGNWIDEKLHYAMDLEFFIRLSFKGYRFMHISKILADFRLQSQSKTCTSSGKQLMEHQQIIFATAPALRSLKYKWIKRLVLALLRPIASAKRYSEKMLRGYYWEQLLQSRSSLDSLSK